MDADRFDDLLRALGSCSVRRGVFAAVPGAVVALCSLTDAEARKNKKRRKGRKNKGSTRAPSCTDGVKNGSETGVNCGGSCPRCANGQRCLKRDDCASALCSVSGSCSACNRADSNPCPGDADGECDCYPTASGAQTVCAKGTNSGDVVTNCEVCPIGTTCFEVSSGAFVCSRLCGAD